MLENYFFVFILVFNIFIKKINHRCNYFYNKKCNKEKIFTIIVINKRERERIFDTNISQNLDQIFTNTYLKKH